MTDFPHSIPIHKGLLLEVSANIDAMTVVVITVSVLGTLGCIFCSCILYRCFCSKTKGSDDDNDIIEWKSGYADAAPV